MSDGRRIDIQVPVLARVEGEGAMHVRIREGEVEDVRLAGGMIMLLQMFR